MAGLLVFSQECRSAGVQEFRSSGAQEVHHVSPGLLISCKKTSEHMVRHGYEYVLIFCPPDLL
jgi:hypothetical protein